VNDGLTSVDLHQGRKDIIYTVGLLVGPTVHRKKEEFSHRKMLPVYIKRRESHQSSVFF
jgi:hypothetical protein